MLACEAPYTQLAKYDCYTPGCRNLTLLQTGAVSSGALLLLDLAHLTPQLLQLFVGLARRLG